jgi:hypothetical protein
MENIERYLKERSSLGKRPAGPIDKSKYIVLECGCVREVPKHLQK